MQVVTSLALADEPGSIQLVASTTQPQAGGAAAQRLAITIPRIPAYFTGTGRETCSMHASMLMPPLFYNTMAEFPPFLTAVCARIMPMAMLLWAVVMLVVVACHMHAPQHARASMHHRV